MLFSDDQLVGLLIEFQMASRSFQQAIAVPDGPYEHANN